MECGLLNRRSRRRPIDEAVFVVLSFGCCLLEGDWYRILGSRSLSAAGPFSECGEYVQFHPDQRCLNIGFCEPAPLLLQARPFSESVECIFSFSFAELPL